jgi:hypothetical protein
VDRANLDRQKPAELTVEQIPSQDIAALLKQYGITKVPKAVYEWGGYRYTNAHDALAAAKRGESA